MTAPQLFIDISRSSDNLKKYIKQTSNFNLIEFQLPLEQSVQAYFLVSLSEFENKQS
jgi:hypothetical protein